MQKQYTKKLKSRRHLRAILWILPFFFLLVASGYFLNLERSRGEFSKVFSVRKKLAPFLVFISEAHDFKKKSSKEDLPLTPSHIAGRVTVLIHSKNLNMTQKDSESFAKITKQISARFQNDIGKNILILSDQDLSTQHFELSRFKSYYILNSENSDYSWLKSLDDGDALLAKLETPGISLVNREGEWIGFVSVKDEAWEHLVRILSQLLVNGQIFDYLSKKTPAGANLEKL